MNIKTLFQKRVTVTRTFFLSAVLLVFVAACVQPGGTLPGPGELDGNAALKSLSVNAGTLRPLFTPGCQDYTLTVRDAVSAINISAERGSAKAGVSGAGKVLLDKNKTEQTVRVTVHAENGDKKTYTIVVTRVHPLALDITSAEELKKIGVDNGFPLEADYTLRSNITLTPDENWAGIASGPGQVFSGTFDGGNNTVTLAGLAVSGNSQGGDLLAGLFCRVGGGEGARARVANLTVDAGVFMSAAVQSPFCVGIIAGCAETADFENIIVTGSVSVTNMNKRPYLGGIAGTAVDAAITNCVNKAEIRGAGKGSGPERYDQVGGIAGMFRGGTIISKCRNDGDIYGASTGQNIFAGGSFFAMSPACHGRIEDCSSSGNIDASGGSMWSMAGGIAGAVTGAGPEGPTRVVRSHASGSIGVDGSAWDYAGGITGYNYTGALVSQCYFSNGTVKGSAYTGGIAGYNSQTAAYNSIIEDCWSGGLVIGSTNSGGIVGQNQINAVIWRCYSIAEVSTTGNNTVGAGGIAGVNANTAANALVNCAALNLSLETAGGNNIHRVKGGGSGFGSGNYAWKDMPLAAAGAYTADKGPDKADGADCDKAPPETFYRNTLAWNFDAVWKMEGGDTYPKLKWQE